MKSYIIQYILIAIVGTSCFAQDNGQNNTPKPQEVLVRIQQETSQPAPKEEKKIVAEAHEWVNLGKNLGQAFDAGLTSLTDHAEKFSKTDAGRFTMLVIAWKVAGKDATMFIKDIGAMIFGIFAQIVWTMIYIWYMRKFLRTYSVPTKITGAFWEKSRIVEYKIVNDLKSEEKFIATLIATGIYCIGSLVIVFGVTI